MVKLRSSYHIIGEVPKGTLRLGTIIHKLDPVKLVPLNDDTIERFEIDQASLFCKHQTDFNITHDGRLNGKIGFGIEVPLLQAVAADASLGGERSFTDEYTFQSLDTLYFQPEPRHYIAASTSGVVLDYLKQSRYQPIFMVTGMKIGKGLTLKRTRSTGTTARLQIGANSGILSLGPSMDIENPETITESYQDPGTYIFAISVSKLSFRRSMFGILGGRILKYEPYVSGAELAGIPVKEEHLGSEAVFEELELTDELKEVGVENEELQNGRNLSWIT